MHYLWVNCDWSVQLHQINETTFEPICNLTSPVFIVTSCPEGLHSLSRWLPGRRSTYNELQKAVSGFQCFLVVWGCRDETSPGWKAVFPFPLWLEECFTSTHTHTELVKWGQNAILHLSVKVMSHCDDTSLDSADVLSEIDQIPTNLTWIRKLCLCGTQYHN